MQDRHGILCFISKLKKHLVEETVKAPPPSDTPSSGLECSWTVVVTGWRVSVTPKIRAGQAGDPSLVSKRLLEYQKEGRRDRHHLKCKHPFSVVLQRCMCCEALAASEGTQAPPHMGAAELQSPLPKTKSHFHLWAFHSSFRSWFF